ncbi:hypothetical protein DFR70_109243 [Nocardia tenerifensis]|uniref:Uncharacterized protein n=1 Tax=Nocardia tenerifensis TaxID=228006 RepID=A0A318K093_9NOCA|nr:hypothetical protein [Nocardia tenerifensis]PXX61052.1 hypothetical protein DFR70_109243 [Nocardia tenerifensis]
MRANIRTGLLVGALLLAPLASAVPASAIPLQPAEPAEQAPVASPGCPGGAPHWSCLLESLSSSGSGR